MGSRHTRPSSQIVAIPADELRIHDDLCDPECRMTGAIARQGFECCRRAGNDPQGILLPKHSSSLQHRHHLDDQEPGANANRPVGNKVFSRRGRRLFLRHDVASFRPIGRPRQTRDQMVDLWPLAKEGPSPAIGWGGRRRRFKAETNAADASRVRHAGRGCRRRRELVNVSPAGGRPSLSPAPGGGPSRVGRRHPLRDEVGCQPSENQSNGLEAFRAPACPSAGLVTVDALDLVHVDDVASCQHRFHPERLVLFPGAQASHVESGVI